MRQAAHRLATGEENSGESIFRIRISTFSTMSHGIIGYYSAFSATAMPLTGISSSNLIRPPRSPLRCAAFYAKITASWKKSTRLFPWLRLYICLARDG